MSTAELSPAGSGSWYVARGGIRRRDRWLRYLLVFLLPLPDPYGSPPRS